MKIKKILTGFLLMTVSSAFFSDLAAASHGDKPVFREQDHARARAELTLPEMLVQGRQKISELEGKDVLFVMGATGSGKSTSIAYLMGAPLDEVDFEGRFVVQINGDSSGFPKIGHKFEAETLFPQAYESIGGISLGDCPGFFDTNTNARIAISVNLELAIKKANTKKILVISSLASITSAEGRGRSIKEVMKTLGYMFKNPVEVKDSVIFGFTTTEKKYAPKNVLGILKGQSGLLTALIGIEREFASKQNIVDKENNDAELLAMIGHEYPGVTAKELRARFVEDRRATQTAIKMIEGLTEEKIVIINPLIPEQRDQIFDKVRAMRDIPIEQFSFDVDEPRRAFRDYAYSIANRACGLFRGLNASGEELSRVQQELIATEEGIKNCNEGITGGADAQEKLIRGFRKEVRDSQKAREDYVYKISRIDMDIQAINTDYLVDLERYHYEEKRSGFFGFLGQSKKEFEYNGIPYVDALIESRKEATDYFSIVENSPSAGKCKAKFIGNSGYDVWADLIIRIKCKDKPCNKESIEKKRLEIAKFESLVREERDKEEIAEENAQEAARGIMTVVRFEENKRVLENKEKELKVRRLNVEKENNKKVEEIAGEIPLFRSIKDISNVMPFLKINAPVMDEFLSLTIPDEDEFLSLLIPHNMGHDDRGPIQIMPQPIPPRVIKR